MNYLPNGYAKHKYVGFLGVELLISDSLWRIVPYVSTYPVTLLEFVEHGCTKVTYFKGYLVLKFVPILFVLELFRGYGLLIWIICQEDVVEG